jgi:hypothetical protein
MRSAIFVFQFVAPRNGKSKFSVCTQRARSQPVSCEQPTARPWCSTLCLKPRHTQSCGVESIRCIATTPSGLLPHAWSAPNVMVTVRCKHNACTSTTSATTPLTLFSRARAHRLLLQVDHGDCAPETLSDSVVAACLPGEYARSKRTALVCPLHCTAQPPLQLRSVNCSHYCQSRREPSSDTAPTLPHIFTACAIIELSTDLRTHFHFYQLTQPSPPHRA